MFYGSFRSGRARRRVRELCLNCMRQIFLPSRPHIPSDTGCISTRRQPVPFSGASIHTVATPLLSVRTSTEYVQAFRPVSLLPVRRSKSYLYFTNKRMIPIFIEKSNTHLCHGQTATILVSHSSISACDTNITFPCQHRESFSLSQDD